jgi:osmotically inducible protein OsmC
MHRKASAVRRLDTRSGQSILSTENVLNKIQYSCSTRLENALGTNPEELLAAAHAGCFAMALSSQLGKAGLRPQNLEASAAVTFEKVSEHFAITKSHLNATLFRAEMSMKARLEATL